MAHPVQPLYNYDSLCKMHNIYVRMVRMCNIYAKPQNFTTNVLEACVSLQLFPLSPFMINKSYIVAHKPCGRQLMAKVYNSKSAIFDLFVQTTRFNNISKMVQVLTVILVRTKLMLITVRSSTLLSVFITSNLAQSIKLFTAQPGYCLLGIGCHLILYICFLHVH